MLIASALERIIDTVLDFRPSGFFHAELQRQHFDRASRSLNAVLDTFLRGHVGHRLLQIVRALSAEALARLILAPETACRLFLGERTDLVFFLGSSVAEHRRMGFIDGDPHPAWTALGDAYYPPNSHEAEFFSEGWVPERLYAAKTLACGIPLDSVSPYAAAPTSGVPIPCVPLEPEKVRRVIEKLNEAVATIAATSAEAAEIVTSHIRVIVARQDPLAPTTSGSFSCEWYPGRATLLNPQEDCVDVADLADSLIHEAIHSMLYVVQVDEPLIKSSNDIRWLRITSPWSGRSLQLHSIVHALSLLKTLSAL